MTQGLEEIARRLPRRIKIFFLTAIGLVSFYPSLSAQTSPTDAQRKIREAFRPEYSELARRMRLTGSVKVQVWIAPDGKVTKAQVVGGHPVLAENAQKAAVLTRFEPGPKETTQIIEFHFDAEK